jgi:membrane associated rhomboid family serine protease
MSFRSAMSFSAKSRPLFYIGEFPVHLYTLLIGIHVALLLVSVAVPDKVFSALHLSLPHLLEGQVWRVVTYAFINPISIWFILNMMFLYGCGKAMEEEYGTRFFSLLYAMGVLLPAVVMVLVALVIGAGTVNPYTFSTHWFLLLAFAFLHPDAGFFIPALKLKWVTLAFFVITILSLLQNRRVAELAAYLAVSGATYWLMRRHGLQSRFRRLGEAVSARMPRRLQGGESNSGRGKKTAKYEPKLKPRAEIDREHPAVIEVDAVLEKISREGFGSLTEKEKQALDRASRELKEKDQRL